MPEIVSGLGINELNAAGALAGTEYVPIFQTAAPAVRTTTVAVANTGYTTGLTVNSNYWMKISFTYGSYSDVRWLQGIAVYRGGAC